MDIPVQILNWINFNHSYYFYMHASKCMSLHMEVIWKWQQLISNHISVLRESYNQGLFNPHNCVVKLSLPLSLARARAAGTSYKKALYWTLKNAKRLKMPIVLCVSTEEPRQRCIVCAWCCGQRRSSPASTTTASSPARSPIPANPASGRSTAASAARPATATTATRTTRWRRRPRPRRSTGIPARRSRWAHDHFFQFRRRTWYASRFKF